jgi:PhnB protein
MSDKNVKNSEYMIPMLVCRDAASEIDFCRTIFGAIELSRRPGEDGSVIHSTLRIGSAMIMIHGEVDVLLSRSPHRDGSSPVVIYAYIQDDVDAVVARAVSAGAIIQTPVMNLPWGDRMGRIMDPAGHVWNVANRPADISSKGPHAA